MSIDDDALGELLDALEIGLELNSAGPMVAPLVQALIDAAPEATLREAADEAVEALWDADLEQDVRTELEAFRHTAIRQRSPLLATVDDTLAELSQPAGGNHVAHALVWRAALKLLRRANRNHQLVARLEVALEHETRADRRRRLTLPIAAAASLAADIGDEEAARAIATYAFSISGRGRRSREHATAQLAGSLGTDARRRAMRASLSELAELSAEDFPLASAALRELLAEPVPDDPARDELWVNLVVGMASEQLEDALAGTTSRRGEQPAR